MRNMSSVQLRVDDHSPVHGVVPSGYTLEQGTFHVGGVPGKLHLLSSYLVTVFCHGRQTPNKKVRINQK